VLVWFAPDPWLYAKYGAVALAELTPEQAAFHQYLGGACLLSILAAAGWILGRPSLGPLAFYAVAPWVVLSLWVFGKRSIVAMTLLFGLYVLWRRGVLRRGALFVVGVAAILLMAWISTTYQSEVRGQHSQEGALYYDGVRLDYGRDASIKLALHHELHERTRPVLEFRGQSLLFYATIAVPRELWPEKPWPYTVYLTAAALESRKKDYLGWALTTSWLDEAVANFSWAGLLLGPLLLAWVCRFGDGSGSALVETLTVVVGALMMSVQLAAFSVVAIAWLVGGLWARIRRRQRSGPALPSGAVHGGATPIWARGRVV
jgi:hypothetical protein